MSPVVRANWLLLALAMVLGSLLLLGRENTEEHDPPLTQLDPATVQRIVIEMNGQRIEELARTGAGWKSLVSGTGVEDHEWLSHLLHIPRLPSLQRFPAPDDPAPFGLDRPRYRLRFDDTVILWGSVEGMSHRRYVRVDDTIHLISDGYTHHLHPAGETP